MEKSEVRGQAYIGSLSDTPSVNVFFRSDYSRSKHDDLEDV